MTSWPGRWPRATQRLSRWLETGLDVADDVRIAVGRALGRSLLLGLGASVACGVFTFSMVESSTQASSVANRFDSLAATRLQIDLPLEGATYARIRQAHLTSIEHEPGIVAVAWIYRDEARVTSITQPHWQVDERVINYTVGGDLSVLAVSPGGPRDSLPGDGLWLGGANDLAGQIPPNAVLQVSGRSMPVAGVLRRSDVAPELLGGVVTRGPGREIDLTRPGRLVIHVRPGWADLVATRIRSQLEPVRPDSIIVRYPPEASSLRSDVVTRIDSLVLVISAALLVISAVAVGLATFARVLERRRLIGLLRAIGASRADVVGGLSVEAAVIGMLAGTLGAVLGLLLATLRATGDGVVIPWPLIGGGLVVAFVVNGAGALVPAWAATRVTPVRAIRGL